MKYAVESEHPEGPASQGLGAALTFWLLSGMGFAVLAACVFMPEWRAYEELQLAEQQAQYHSELVNQSLTRERHLLKAMQSDPAVIGRLARRELGFHGIDDKTIYVEKTVLISEPPSIEFIAKKLEPPAFVSSMLPWLPAFDYDRVFCDGQTRKLLMFMSVGLIASAFLLFGRPRERLPQT